MARYTCPMHAEVVQEGPGPCPICGMALEAEEVSAVEEASPEERLMTRRFWVSLALTVPVFVLASVLSRGLRFYAEAGLLYWKGPSISRFIDKYFNLLAWLFAALIIAGFLALEFLL